MLFNKGSRKDCVKELRCVVVEASGEQRKCTPGIAGFFPVVLGENEASPPMFLYAIDIPPENRNAFQRALAAGNGIRWLEVENIRNETVMLPVPPGGSKS